MRPSRIVALMLICCAGGVVAPASAQQPLKIGVLNDQTAARMAVEDFGGKVRPLSESACPVAKHD
jgi:hypothetical protein